MNTVTRREYKPGQWRILTSVIAMVLMVSSALAQTDRDWSVWRGPNYDGTINAPEVHLGSDLSLEVLWSRTVGQGYSGISIAGGRTLAMFTDGTDDVLAAFDAKSGQERWRYRLGPIYQGHDGGHDGPVSTPVADQDSVYALGADGRLVAVGATDGVERWSVSLPGAFGSSTPFWGFSTTPLLVDDLVIVQAGGSNGRSLVALSKVDGTVRWTAGRGGVEYQSPVLAVLNGRRQVLASSAGETVGVDPGSGEVLWTLSDGGSSSTTPVPVGDDGFLLPGRSGVALYRLTQSRRTPRRVWRTNELRGNYATPVVVGRHIYGYAGHYLVCVDLETGRRRWRSRPPGGKGLIAINDRLVLLGAKGYVVVAAADPDRYRELARVKVSDADGYSWPSFADGVIYVRNLKHLVAVRPVDSGLVARTPTVPVHHRFGSFIGRLTVATDKKSLLDEFMSKQQSFPIVEDGRFVHFVYRGRAIDVAILGNMLAQGEEDGLHRVEGTDFFHRSYAIEPGARWEYQFKIDFEQVRPDPLNTRFVKHGQERGQALSEVATPQWQTPPFERRYEGDATGDFDSFAFTSTIAGGRRDIRVYLPPGYRSNRNARYPLVVVNGGRAWLDEGGLPNTLNHLAAGGVDTPVVAFIAATSQESHRELGGAGTDPYVKMLARELMPELDRRYRLRPQVSQRLMFGRRAGAVAAVYATVLYPDVFGGCIAISYGRADTVRQRKISAYMRAIEGDKPHLFITWNRYEIWRPQSFDVREQSMLLAAELETHGFEVDTEERLDGAGWRSWSAQAARSLQAMLGKSP